MRRQRLIVAAVSVLLVSVGVAWETGKEPGQSKPFDKAQVWFEQNATDSDVEVVFAVTGGDDGLAKLTVIAPDGRQVVVFTAPDVSTLGIRSFHFESPEPLDVESLKAAYPQGVYTFLGVTAAGEQLRGESTLSHHLPATASLLRPVAAEEVQIKDLNLQWNAVENVEAYIVEIEQDELDVNLTAKLLGSVNTFAVPNGFLLPATEYQLAIGTVTQDGNTSFVEATFTTAGKQ